MCNALGAMWPHQCARASDCARSSTPNKTYVNHGEMWCFTLCLNCVITIIIIVIIMYYHCSLFSYIDSMGYNGFLWPYRATLPSCKWSEMRSSLWRCCCCCCWCTYTCWVSLLCLCIIAVVFLSIHFFFALLLVYLIFGLVVVVFYSLCLFSLLFL